MQEGNRTGKENRTSFKSIQAWMRVRCIPSITDIIRLKLVFRKTWLRIDLHYIKLWLGNVFSFTFEKVATVNISRSFDRHGEAVWAEGSHFNGGCMMMMTKIIV